MPKIHHHYSVRCIATSGLMLLSSVASMVLAAPKKGAHAGKKHPNVIYVFPDQFRNSAMGFWRDSVYRQHVGWQGDPVHTPNLNRFATQSVVFSRALSNCPISSAHRGMLLTGLYPNKSGVSLNCNATRPISDLRDDLCCMSDVFHNAGYQCAYIGKLHANFPTRNNPQKPGEFVNNDNPCWDAYTPKEKRHGFDYWYSYGTFDEHKNPHYWDTDGNYHEPHEFSPKHEADKAIEYLQAHAHDAAPIFMMVGMNPPHSPYRSLSDCMEEDYNLYKDIPLDSLLVRPNLNPALADKMASAPYYFANITGVDREFGRILAALDSLGLAENTIVVFASDHGETMCSHVRDPKNTVYTESMNIPFIVRYPKRLAPAISDNMLSAIDIMPTVVGLAGLEKMLPDSLPGYNWAGRHPQKRMVMGSKDAPRSILYLQNVDGDKDVEGNVTTYFARCRGIVSERYTLSFTLNKKGKLKEVLFFDNEKDPYQTQNLPIAEHREVVAQLLQELDQLLKEADDPWYHNHTVDSVRLQLGL